MRTLQSQLAVSNNAADCSCILAETTPLGALVEQVDLDKYAYLIVVNENRQVVGVVETADIVHRLSANNPAERSRWQAMQLGAMIQGRFDTKQDPADEHGFDGSAPLECTAVRENGRVVALVSESEVFVTWSVIRQGIRHILADPVTGLPTRAVFDNRLPDEIGRAQRHQQSLAVLLIDVDRFKQINDSLGHDVGDTVLGRVATVLRQQLRSYDIVVRYGGDEFAAICCGCDQGTIDIAIRRVQQGIKALREQNSMLRDPVTVSIGAAVVHTSSVHCTADELVKGADLCLYQAKDEGRNRAFKIELTHPNQMPAPRQIEPAVVPLDSVASLPLEVADGSLG